MKKIKTIIRIVCLVAVIAMTASCKPGVPDDYIQPGEMEDILYDYHIAMAMADQGDPSQRDVRIIAYKQAVLKKYDCTEAQVDSSMAYYMRHTDRLHDIYENLAERLDDEAKDLGANGSNITKQYAVNGDTANVWKGANALVLMPEPGFNSYSFEIKVDSAFHAGDRFQMQFSSNYIIQEGSRNAVAVIALTFDNDSTISQVMRISSDSRQTSMFGGFDNMKLKSIRGYILFPPDNGMTPSTTVKILCITDIQFLRIHAPKAATPSAGAPMPNQSPSGPNAPMPSQPTTGPGAPMEMQGREHNTNAPH